MTNLSRFNPSALPLNPARSIRLLFVAGVIGCLVGGCAEDGARRSRPSYTSTRTMRTGSNIPQPYSADATYGTMGAGDMERAGNNAAISGIRAGGY